MNENIDLIEILKDCPKGTKLYSRSIGTVTFDCIKSDRICIKNHKGIETAYIKSAKYCYAEEDAEIDLFPSKDQRDWSKWHRPFVDGDVVMYDDDQFAIFEKYIKYPEDDGLIRYYVYYDANNDDLDAEGGQAYVQRLATEEEKQKLFDVLKKEGYEWDAEKKELKTLQLFKDGDIVANNDGKYIAIIENNGGKYYVCCHPNVNYFNIDGSGWFDRLATEEEKATLFQAIKDKGYKWNAETKTLEKLISNKFDPKTLQPFDKVLVSYSDEWFCDFFSHYDDAVVKFNCICAGGCTYECCIPYNDDTKHLIGKSIEEAPEFYRYWEHK